MLVKKKKKYSTVEIIKMWYFNITKTFNKHLNHVKISKFIE